MTSSSKPRRRVSRPLRPLTRADLARVAGGEEHANLPLYAEILVVGHTVSHDDDNFRFYVGGYWYPAP